MFTGPYMIPSDSTGKITGYQPGRSITLVRNPNWDKSTDWRPAYLDKILVKEGNDPTVGNRQVLTGQSMVSNHADLAPPPAILKQASTSYKSQFSNGPFTGRFRYIAMNTTVKPFDNINVRKAVIAAMNKNALRLAFGGPLVGAIPTHFIAPAPGNGVAPAPAGEKPAKKRAAKRAVARKLSGRKVRARATRKAAKQKSLKAS